MRKTFVFKFLLICLALFISSRVGAELKNPAEVGPQIGYLMIEGDSNVESDGVYGARIGTYFYREVAAELSVMAGQASVRNTNKTADIFFPSIELQKYFGHFKWKPFIAGGLGYLQVNRDRRVAKNEIDFAFVYGAGVKWHFSRSFLARLDARHIVDTESGKGTHNGLLSLGVSWVYGNEEVEKKSIQPVVAPPVVRVFDADQDGVPDNIDACPETPFGMKVDPKGCLIPIDSDGDGIKDDIDECPGTPTGTVVDAVGCPAETQLVPEKEWILKGVRFESGSDKLTSDSIKGLEEAVGILTVHASVRVEIQGHTDRLGAAELNQKLSDARAVAVKTYLVGRGISADRLETKGFGFSKPITDNKTAQSRAKNRRIEFRVLSR